MTNLSQMHFITAEEHEAYIADSKTALQAKPNSSKSSKKTLGPPIDYKYESTTVWSFPDRGNWATHNGRYRGNWSPYIPRNLVQKYTNEGDIVLDQMCGSGTTLVECKLLKRNGIGVDINPHAVMLAYTNLNFDIGSENHWTKIYVGDARNLNEIKNASIDLIATHPPYAGMIPYSKRTIDGDLSALSIPNYTKEMHKVAQESFRILKPGKYCGILIGDTRKHLHYVPLSLIVVQLFLEAGFVLKEDIIKLQWNMKGTRERWRGSSYDFYKIAHEHLFVFRKPRPEEKRIQFKLSSSDLINAVSEVINSK